MRRLDRFGRDGFEAGFRRPCRISTAMSPQQHPQSMGFMASWTRWTATEMRSDSSASLQVTSRVRQSTDATMSSTLTSHEGGRSPWAGICSTSPKIEPSKAVIACMRMPSASSSAEASPPPASPPERHTYRRRTHTHHTFILIRVRIVVHYV